MYLISQAWLEHPSSNLRVMSPKQLRSVIMTPVGSPIMGIQFPETAGGGGLSSFSIY